MTPSLAAASLHYAVPAPHFPRENESQRCQLRQRGGIYYLHATQREKPEPTLDSKGGRCLREAPPRPALLAPGLHFPEASTDPRSGPSAPSFTLSGDWLSWRRAGPAPANRFGARYGGGSGGTGLRGGGQSARAPAAAASLEPRTSAPQAGSAQERAQGGAVATRHSTQVMAGRAPGRGGEETRGRGGGAGLQRPSRCASPGKGSGAASPAAQTWALWQVGHGGWASGRGQVSCGKERRGVGLTRAWGRGGRGPWRGSRAAGERGRAGTPRVWLLEQFKVTLHIRALGPPLLDPGRGGASQLSAPLSGSTVLFRPLVPPRGV